MRNSNNNVVKTVESGICRHCKEEVVWCNAENDYKTANSHQYTCFYSASATGYPDHEPLGKSDNFSSLYNKLLG